jgi:transposase
MRKIEEVLRLYAAGYSTRRIGASLGLGRSTVSEYLRRARQAGVSWPLPEELTEARLETRLFPGPRSSGGRAIPQPDWSAVSRELKKRGVTLSLLWDEYRGDHPDGYGYSAFCDQYRLWERRLSPSMRQRHVAGERLFVDYSGTGMEVIDPRTGESRKAEVFIAVLGASNYTFAEATWTQTLEDWIGSHVRALEFFGAVPAMVVCDNLKSGVIRACFYEPEINRSYADLARHYGTAVLPARPHKPKDKAKVEGGVLLVQRWIVARLRNRRFFSLQELNAAIAIELERLNGRASRHLGASRRDLFETVERPAMRPLPPTRHVHADWKKVTAGADYHVHIDGHHYSVPHELCRQALWARLTATTVEVFKGGRRVAAHARAAAGDTAATTLNEHMPASHRRYAEMTPQKVRDKAGRIGPDCAMLIDVILRDRPHPEHGIRSSMGILRLARTYGDERLEAACGRALLINARSLTSVRSILQNRLEDRPTTVTADSPPIAHDNIRGAKYFH